MGLMRLGSIKESLGPEMSQERLRGKEMSLLYIREAEFGVSAFDFSP